MLNNLNSYFVASNDLELTIIQTGSSDDNWKNESVVLKLSAGATVSPSPALFTLSTVDDDTAPVAKFTPSSVKLTERSNTTATLHVKSGDDDSIPSGISKHIVPLRIIVRPADLVVTGAIDGTGEGPA